MPSTFKTIGAILLASAFSLFGQADWSSPEWTAVSLIVNASGGIGARGSAGGAGGNIDIRTGVNVDTGDGSLGEPAPSTVLQGCSGSEYAVYNYRQVPPGTTLTICGNVEIRCQFVFAPFKVIGRFEAGSAPPRVRVHAGQSLRVFQDACPPGVVIGNCEAQPARHSAEFVMTPTAASNGEGIDGGDVTFHTTQRGGIGALRLLAAGTNSPPILSFPPVYGAGGRGGNITVLAAERDFTVQSITTRGGDHNGIGELPHGGDVLIRCRRMFGSPSFDCDISGGNGSGNGGLLVVEAEQHPIAANIRANGGAGGLATGRRGGNSGSIYGLDEFLGSADVQIRGGNGGWGEDGPPGVSNCPRDPGFIWCGTCSETSGTAGGPGGNGGDAGGPGAQAGLGGPGGMGGQGGYSITQLPPCPAGTNFLIIRATNAPSGPDGQPGTVSGSPMRGYVAPPNAETNAWTIMVYVAGDSSDIAAPEVETLYQWGKLNLAGSSIRVIVQMDRYAKSYFVRNDYNPFTTPKSVPSFAPSWGKWSDTRRGFITYTTNPPSPSSELADRMLDWLISERQIASTFVIADSAHPELNSAAPQTLNKFISWAKAMAPADRYILVLQGHGAGWRGLMHDQNAPGYSSSSGFNDRITMKELGLGLSGLGKVADIVVVGGCQIQVPEVVTELYSRADYMIGPQHTEEASTLAPDVWLKRLVANPAMSSRAFAELIWAEIRDKNKTLSLIDVSQVPGLNQALDEFALAVLGLPTAPWGQLSKARNKAPVFKTEHGFDNDRDLLAFMTAVDQDATMPSSVRDAARAVLSARQDLVLQHKAGGGGVSLYLPLDGNLDTRYRESVSFADPDFKVGSEKLGTHWLHLLFYWGEPATAARRVQPDADTTFAPPVSAFYQRILTDWGDSFDDALPFPTTPNHRNMLISDLGTARDIDVVRFEATAGQVLYCDLLADSLDDRIRLVLGLYDSSQTLLARVLTDSDGFANLRALPLLVTGAYFLAVSTTDPSGLPLAQDDPAFGPSANKYSLQWIFGEQGVLAPEISVSNSVVNLGPISLNDARTVMVHVANSGGTGLLLTQVLLATNSRVLAPFPPIPLPEEIPPGSSLNLPLTLVGLTNGVVNETLELHSNDPLNPVILIHLTADIFPAPRLATVFDPGSEMLLLEVTVAPGRDYRLERSTNFVDWTTITNFPGSLAAPIEFRENVSTPAPIGFYRVATP